MGGVLAGGSGAGPQETKFSTNVLEEESDTGPLRRPYQTSWRESGFRGV